MSSESEAIATSNQREESSVSQSNAIAGDNAGPTESPSTAAAADSSPSIAATNAEDVSARENAKNTTAAIAAVAQAPPAPTASSNTTTTSAPPTNTATTTAAAPAAEKEKHTATAVPEEKEKSNAQPNQIGGQKSELQHSKERRIIAEDPEWNLAPVDKLTDLCVRVLVANFEKKPSLKGLPPKYRTILINTISPTLPLKIVAPLIPDQAYWKRRTQLTYKLDSVIDHGGDWKRMYFELHLRDEIEEFEPWSEVSSSVGGMEGRVQKLHEELQVGAPFVETLKVRQLRPLLIVGAGEEEELLAAVSGKNSGSGNGRNVAQGQLKLQQQKAATAAAAAAAGIHLDHLDLGLILSHLVNLKEFSVYYGLNNCGIDFSWAYFGMTMQDTISLTRGLKSFSLRKLSIQASWIDCDKCRLICSALLANSHLQYLDSGARGLAKLISSPHTSLQTLKLSNNQIGKEGVQSIGKALQTPNAKLTSLDLRLNHLGDAGGHTLLVSLFKARTLKNLDISGNGLETKSVLALGVLLKMNLSGLEGLDLSCNKLGDYTGVIGGLGAAAAAANGGGAGATGGSNSNLLNAGVPKISDVAGKTIFEAISQNKYITSFDLRTTGISPEYLVAINGIIGENAQQQQASNFPTPIATTTITNNPTTE